MDKKDAQAIEWAIKKYHKTKSDEWIAEKLGHEESVVRETRKEMGLELPKGNESLKEYARRFIMEMNEEDKRQFVKSLPPELVWRMAEGNPHSTEDSTVKHIIPIPIMSLDEPMKGEVLAIKN